MFVCEELHRIDLLIAEPHFKVQVRARNPPGPAEIADILALLDLLAFPDSEFVQMGVTQDDAFSGIDVDGQAIGAFTAAVYDLAGRGSNDFFPAISGDIHTRVHEPPTFDGMLAGAEGRRDPDSFLDGLDERKSRVERRFLEQFRRDFNVAVVEFFIGDGSEADVGTVLADGGAGCLEFAAGRVGKRFTCRGAIVMQGRQGIMIADDGILVVLQAGLLWSAGGEEKEAKEGGEKGKPFCCAERQIRRFERHEGFLVYRGRMHSGEEGSSPRS